jgi:aryl-phospho-beta-D-glucosidase BglC (GH1 family)
MRFIFTRVVSLMVCVLGAASGAALAADDKDKTLSRDHVWLSVKGSDLVTSPKSKGGERRFIPAGVGYARDVIIKAQDDEVMKFCKERSLNTVRLAFYTNRFNGDTKKPIDIDQHIDGFIDPVVKSAVANNMYVILDDHEYFHQRVDEDTARGTQTSAVWDEKTLNQWIDRWVKIATRYKDEPNVLGYELQNEPNGIAPEIVRDWYTRCLKAIRQVDKRHIIIVGNHNWSHSRAMEGTWGAVAKTVDAPYNQVVFAFHDYPLDDEPWKVQRNITAFRDKYNVPVMCTEFGATWWDHDETTCRQFQSGMMSVFSKENVGWMIWALKTVIDNPRNPTPPNRNKDESKEDYAVRMKEHRARYNGKPPFDSLAYSDIWAPTARIMASEFPKPADN